MPLCLYFFITRFILVFISLPFNYVNLVFHILIQIYIMPLTISQISGVLQCDKDLFGRSDPYCIIQLGGQKFQTQVVSGGGKTPRWVDTFNFNASSGTINVQVWDSDLGPDDKIGEGSYQISNLTGGQMIKIPIKKMFFNNEGSVSMFIQPSGGNQGFGGQQQGGWGGQQGQQQGGWGGQQGGQQGGWGGQQGGQQGGWGGQQGGQQGGWGGQQGGQQGGWGGQQGGQHGQGHHGGQGWGQQGGRGGW